MAWRAASEAARALAITGSMAGVGASLSLGVRAEGQDSELASPRRVPDTDWLHANRATMWTIRQDSGQLDTTSNDNLMVFSGNGNPELAEEIVTWMNRELNGCQVGRFRDGEVSVRVLDNVRGQDVYIIQSTGPPVSENIMELLFMITTMKRASAGRVVVVMPYMAYKRSTGMALSSSISSHMSEYLDHSSNMPLFAADVAHMIVAAGADHVISLDITPPGMGQVEGFYPACDNIRSTGLAVEYLARQRLSRPVIVAANEAMSPLARDVAQGMVAAGCDPKDVDVAMVLAGRSSSSAADTAARKRAWSDVTSAEDPLAAVAAERGHPREVVELVGDVAGRDVVVVDDMVDTGRTLAARVACLKASGAQRVLCFAAHGLFSRGALYRIEASEVEKVIVSDSLPRRKGEGDITRKVVRLSMAPVLAEAIVRLHRHDSLFALSAYDSDNTEERYRGQEKEVDEDSEEVDGDSAHAATAADR